MGIPFVGGFESTFQPHLDVDVAETCGHIARWRADLDLLRGCGVTQVRYPVRWHRVEAVRGRYDWADTDEVFGYLRDTGMAPIVDLCHHTSYPRWLRRGFADRRFGDAYLRYVEAFAERYPWVPEYTLFNEPFTSFLLAGDMGIWPPHLEGLKGFLTLAVNVFPAVAEASRRLHDLLPGARHVYTEPCERHRAAGPAAQRHADYANDRRFFLLDLLVGRDDVRDRSRPFVAAVVEAGGGRLLDLAPGHVDVVGLDYYAHNQLEWDSAGRPTRSFQPRPLTDLIREYGDRYRLPCALSETNIRGFASDRASWFKYTLEQCERAMAAGLPLESYCWYPTVDSCDWDSMLTRSDGHIDPVGVFWLDRNLERRRSVMSEAYTRAANGTPSSELPAYRLQPPVSSWLEGWLPQMSHWDWQDPPP